MSKGDSKPKTSDWTRCFEGIADLSGTIAGSSKAAAVKRKSADNFGFGHGNIFEKLGLAGNEDATSQSIVWSSSESDGEAEKTGSAVTPVVKKQRRGWGRTSPKKPARTSLKSKASTAADAVEILTVSDDETTKQSSITAGKTNETKAYGEEISIAGFESGSEEVEPCKNQEVKTIVSQGDSQPCILSMDSLSPPPTGAAPPTGVGRKASDWFKSLQLKTPSKSEQGPQDDGAPDSAKKKKKNKKGGLAEQMLRLQARDRSSVRMWAHKQNKPSASQDCKSSTLTVLSVESLYSMQLVRCSVSVSTSGAGDLVPASGTEDLASSSRLVLFTGNQAEQLNLQTGTQFKIFPPWQQLELNGGQMVLLCTKYCLLQSGPSPRDERQATHPLEKYGSPVRASWNCPCVQGLCRSMSLCPASKFPAVAGHLQESTTTIDNQKQEIPTDLSKGPSPRKPSHLQTVSPSKPIRTLSCGGVVEEDTCDSILKSIQGRKLIGVEPGNTTLVHNLKFTAHVHRHIVQCKKDDMTSYILVVEDNEGHVGVVRLPLGMYTPILGLEGCEGRTLRFEGLSVTDRVTRDRDEALFSMVDQVWSGKVSDPSQDSSFSQEQPHQVSNGKQDFCYIMSAGPDGPPSIHVLQSSIIPASQQSDVPLNTLLINQVDPVRCSVIARLIYIHKQSDATQPCLVYITDPSIQKSCPYVTVPLSREISLPDELTMAKGKTAILLRDVLVSQGGPQIDGYTLLKLLTPSSVVSDRPRRQLVAKLRAMQVPLKPLSHDLVVNDLCQLEGVISEVDEDSAYSWEACVHCGGDQLKTDSNISGFVCSSCTKTMTEGVTRMKMEVMVVCDVSKCKAKIDLLQRTIEKLLPAEEGDEEGYELSSVLNKSVGPLHCMVSNKTSDLVTLREIDMLT
ncbi:DNA repair-scaffolding protein-like [Dreissena polymorpha]|uniref:DUF4503 domain-containing protein n=1 Tax=Dreissena polymorpha TaxID=45954 RepID=A0A9D4EEK1_DREPO|nr:DNA repair-scaffolding protein-like [Dreissena polymorpha]KAH3776775.1 hypothetical protein DPMN_178207 [Dreissena polymorpha]